MGREAHRAHGVQQHSRRVGHQVLGHMLRPGLGRLGSLGRRSAVGLSVPGAPEAGIQREMQRSTPPRKKTGVWKGIAHPKEGEKETKTSREREHGLSADGITVDGAEVYSSRYGMHAKARRHVQA